MNLQQQRRFATWESRKNEVSKAARLVSLWSEASSSDPAWHPSYNDDNFVEYTLAHQRDGVWPKTGDFRQDLAIIAEWRAKVWRGKYDAAVAKWREAVKAAVKAEYAFHHAMNDAGAIDEMWNNCPNDWMEEIAGQFTPPSEAEMANDSAGSGIKGRRSALDMILTCETQAERNFALTLLLKNVASSPVVGGWSANDAERFERKMFSALSKSERSDYFEGVANPLIEALNRGEDIARDWDGHHSVTVVEAKPYYTVKEVLRNFAHHEGEYEIHLMDNGVIVGVIRWDMEGWRVIVIPKLSVLYAHPYTGVL